MIPVPPNTKEQQNLEWKESWRDDYLRWICGFANAEGGVLIIGRNDRGQPVGVANAARLLEEIPNKARDVLGIMVAVNLVSEDGKELVEIRVDPYPSPVSYKGEYHYRSGSTKQELRGAALSHFLLKKQGLHWDSVPVPYVSVADLDTRVLGQFRMLALKSQRLSAEMLQEPDAALLEKLHLVERDYLKRAAVLLFHPDPERHVGGAYIKIGFFESNVDLRYQDEVHGDVLSQVGKTLDALKAKYLKAWISYDGLQRIETYPVPEPALREALLNAVVHKDYASGIPVQISVYPDKLMIWNPGQLPPQWTVERLLAKHASAPFNPDLANAFFRAGLVEAWGRGIERMLETCRQAGLDDPVFAPESTGVWVTFNFAPSTAGRPTQETAQETTQELSPSTQERVCLLLQGEPRLTRRELAERLSLTPDGVKYHLQKLKAMGRIRHVGSTKAGHWEVLK